MIFTISRILFEVLKEAKKTNKADETKYSSDGNFFYTVANLFAREPDITNDDSSEVDDREDYLSSLVNSIRDEATASPAANVVNDSNTPVSTSNNPVSASDLSTNNGTLGSTNGVASNIIKAEQADNTANTNPEVNINGNDKGEPVLGDNGERYVGGYGRRSTGLQSEVGGASEDLGHPVSTDGGRPEAGRASSSSVLGVAEEAGRNEAERAEEVSDKPVFTQKDGKSSGDKRVVLGSNSKTIENPEAGTPARFVRSLSSAFGNENTT